MGSELIYPIGIGFGGLALTLLFYLAVVKASRPFAIPTFAAAVLWAWGATRHVDGIFVAVGTFSIEFVFAVAVFGLHAIFIKVALVLLSNDGGSPPRPHLKKEVSTNDDI